jgi:dTDP-4-dehydrorhamnose reductase
MRQAGRKTKVVPIKSSEYAYKTPRPAYSVLDKTKIKKTFGITIPQWQESLAKCLVRL